MNETSVRALTEHEVAARLGLKVSTLRAWRTYGEGPAFVRFGRAVRYLDSDIARYIEMSRAETPARQHR